MWWGPKRLPDGQDKAPRGLRGRSALEATVLALAASGRPVRPDGEGRRALARGAGAGPGRGGCAAAARSARALGPGTLSVSAGPRRTLGTNHVARRSGPRAACRARRGGLQMSVARFALYILCFFPFSFFKQGMFLCTSSFFSNKLP